MRDRSVAAYPGFFGVGVGGTLQMYRVASATRRRGYNFCIILPTVRRVNHGVQLRGRVRRACAVCICRRVAVATVRSGALILGRREAISPPSACELYMRGLTAALAARTGVNPAGDAGDTSPNILVRRDVNWNIPQCYYVLSDMGGSVAEWFACWTQARKGPGSNRSRDAVG